MSQVFPIEDDPRYRLSTATEGQTEFTVPFPFQANADIAVIRIAVDGTEAELEEAEDYQLTGAGETTGGTLTLETECVAGEQLLRIGRAELTRLTSIVRGGKFMSAATDADLDRFTIIAQELKRDAARALKVPFGTDGDQTVEPGRDDYIAIWEDGRLIEGPPVDELVGEPGHGVAWRGAWEIGRDYVEFDAVSHDGSSWIANASSTGDEPGVEAVWDIWVEKGTAGAQGETGETGETGAQGVQGETGPAAVGQHTIWMPAAAMVSATTNGAASGSAESTTNKVMRVTKDFDASTEEFAQFFIQMPKSWDEGTLIFQAVWSHASTTTNFGVAWGLEAVAFADGDAIDSAWGTEVALADTGGSTDSIYISPESGAVTVGGTPGAEEFVAFRVTRVVANASDTLAVDARLHGIKIHYTTDAASDD